MQTPNHDKNIIEHILRYCNQVETAHRDFQHSKDKFIESTTYQNAISMCILQIGELVGRLTNAFKANHSEIPWHKIRGMRNYVAHKYGAIDFEIVWFASTKSIPDLRSFCEFFLSE
ncbi:MAG: DUF86 domain-containing protein [Christensenellales bacterium]|jgi:uncharacterized protein with HEPN domain